VFLLLDEPLEGLAPMLLADELMTAFERLARSGTLTIVLVEQHIDKALSFARAPPSWTVGVLSGSVPARAWPIGPTSSTGMWVWISRGDERDVESI
jgi:ABC-type nitrate/sulfonate/bicarbonate transport system ATPase subunit